MEHADLEPLDFLRLVAEPVRWRLLGELASSDRRVGELCDLVGRPQSLVSYHLRELRTGGLVSARQSAADGRDTYYRSDVGRFVRLLGATGAAVHPATRVARIDADLPTIRGRKARVLFLCTGNSARSQMAEAFMEHRTRGRVVARSAGSHPKPVHPEAVRTMARRGIDISGSRPKHLDRFSRQRFDRVITLCDKVKEICPELPGHPVTAHWSMADPSTAEDGAAAFVRTGDEIEARVDLLIAQLAAHHDDERTGS